MKKSNWLYLDLAIIATNISKSLADSFDFAGENIVSSLLTVISPFPLNCVFNIVAFSWKVQFPRLTSVALFGVISEEIISLLV